MKQKAKKPMSIMESEWVSREWKDRQTHAEAEAARRLMATVRNRRGAYDLAYARKLLERAVKDMD